jgi:hypothetical protein
MVCQPLRLALLIGAITAVAVSPARADFRAPGCCDPCGPSTTAPAFRTVTCTEWVREAYTTKRTVYRVECRTETYDTCRTECVPVCKDQVVTVMKRVPCWTEECRKVCHKVTCYEDRVVNKTCYKNVQETCMKKQLVRLGHWECKEVTPLFGGGLFSGHGHSCCSSGCGGDACGSCAPACTRTKKVWVHCPEYRECPVTVCKKVAYCEQVHCKVAVCKNEWREEKVKVCKYTCVPETCVKKVTCYERRQVACKATRTVRVCVPHEECVTCCKLVPRTVTRQVPCAPACNNACSDSCCPREGLLSRLRDRFGSCGCSHSRDCCRSSCCN